MYNFGVGCFVFNHKVYQAGTKILYSGPCILDNNRITVDNIVMSFMYYDGGYNYCKSNGVVYKIADKEFQKNIIRIMLDENKAPPEAKSETYWTDDMVINTIWYIVIMIASSLFYDRVGLWILATVIWYFSTFKKK